MLTTVARIAGGLLRAGIALILLVRRPRPIHARGTVLEGDLRWLPRARQTGIAWIDAPVAGTVVPVAARVSRGVGLPSWLPDVYGLALRTESSEGPADLELSSSGIGVPGRFLLVPHRSALRGTLGTLLPYEGTRGPLMVCARTTVGPASGSAEEASPTEPWRLRLYAAAPAGRWHPFADLTLRRGAAKDDASLRFDAVRHPLPGAGTYEWTRALRQPSYHLAQRRSE